MAETVTRAMPNPMRPKNTAPAMLKSRSLPSRLKIANTTDETTRLSTSRVHGIQRGSWPAVSEVGDAGGAAGAVGVSVGVAISWLQRTRRGG